MKQKKEEELQQLEEDVRLLEETNQEKKKRVQFLQDSCRKYNNTNTKIQKNRKQNF